MNEACFSMWLRIVLRSIPFLRLDGFSTTPSCQMGRRDASEHRKKEKRAAKEKTVHIFSSPIPLSIEITHRFCGRAIITDQIDFVQAASRGERQFAVFRNWNA